MPIDDLLLGGQNSLTAIEWAEATGQLWWGSTRVVDGPHAALLRVATQCDLTDEAVLASEYARFARRVIATTGNFFAARDDAAVLAVTRDFVSWHKERSAPRMLDSSGRSQLGSHVRAARIKGSNCYQVIDGHHRVASLGIRGETSVRVRVSWLPVTTPVQETLDRMSWIGGQRELYQPLPAPELARSWVNVRKCTDRLDKMTRFLTEVDRLPERPTYLDVASCYGWFVSRMLDSGYDAYGVERDPLGRVLGNAAYGLDPTRVHVADAETFLAGAGRRWDVVSCLSLLHHFALGRASMGAEEFLHLLDSVTGHVLILDTGQTHEEWLTHRLPGWDTADIIRRLRLQTTFDEIFDLGPDEDSVGFYSPNYGRHLFACVRHS